VLADSGREKGNIMKLPAFKKGEKKRRAQSWVELPLKNCGRFAKSRDSKGEGDHTRPGGLSPWGIIFLLGEKKIRLTKGDNTEGGTHIKNEKLGAVNSVPSRGGENGFVSYGSGPGLLLGEG